MTVGEKIETKYEGMSEIKKTMCIVSCILSVTTFITFFPLLVLIISQSFLLAGASIILMFIVLIIVFISFGGSVDLTDIMIAVGFAFGPTTYLTMYFIIKDDEDILSCFYNVNGINWFVLNIWKTMTSKYLKVYTNDISLYADYQLVDISKSGNGNITMYVRVRNDTEEAMLLLLQN